MRITEKVTHTYVAEDLVKLVCDLCKQEFPEGWAPGNFDDIETTVRLKVGHAYPGDAYGDIREVDICPGCFRDKLIPWLREQGAELRETSY